MSRMFERLMRSRAVRRELLRRARELQERINAAPERERLSAGGVVTGGGAPVPVEIAIGESMICGDGRVYVMTELGWRLDAMLDMSELRRRLVDGM